MIIDGLRDAGDFDVFVIELKTPDMADCRAQS